MKCNIRNTLFIRVKFTKELMAIDFPNLNIPTFSFVAEACGYHLFIWGKREASNWTKTGFKFCNSLARQWN